MASRRLVRSLGRYRCVRWKLRDKSHGFSRIGLERYLRATILTLRTRPSSRKVRSVALRFARPQHSAAAPEYATLPTTLPNTARSHTAASPPGSQYAVYRYSPVRFCMCASALARLEPLWSTERPLLVQLRSARGLAQLS